MLLPVGPAPARSQPSCISRTSLRVSEATGRDPCLARRSFQFDALSASVLGDALAPNQGLRGEPRRRPAGSDPFFRASPTRSLPFFPRDDESRDLAPRLGDRELREPRDRLLDLAMADSEMCKEGDLVRRRRYANSSRCWASAHTPRGFLSKKSRSGGVCEVEFWHGSVAPVEQLGKNRVKLRGGYKRAFSLKSKRKHVGTSGRGGSGMHKPGAFISSAR